jgi:multiple sugar transport system substrate-binding protein
MAHTPSSHPGTVNRRQLLTGAGAAAAGLWVAGCSDDGSANGDGQPTPGSSGAPGQLSGGTVRFWTIPEGPEDERNQREQLDIFMESNPDVTVEADFFAQDAYAEALQAGFVGGDAPDVFRIGGGINLESGLQRGWIRPIEEFLTDEFVGRFPAYVYDHGNRQMYRDGEAYGVPFAEPVSPEAMLHYNVGMLADNGFDQPPATWSEFREMATKISRDGGGSIYGTYPRGQTSVNMHALAGPEPYPWNYDSPPISLLTGEPAMSEPSLIETIELWQGMEQDGALAPGFEVVNSLDAVQLMASGQLGMVVASTFLAFQMREANPDIEFDIAAPPVPDSGQAGSYNYRMGILCWWMMSSEVREPEPAWRLMDFLGSAEFRQAAMQNANQWVILSEGVDVDPFISQQNDISADILRIHPDPNSKDPGASQFYFDLVTRAPQPGPTERYLQAIAGADFRASAAEYDDQLAATIEDMLNESDITMDAFSFPDWNPLEDYAF